MTKKDALNYNKLLLQSEKFLANKQYQKAISFAKQANKLNPEEGRPNEIIIVCYDNLDKSRLDTNYRLNLWYIENFPHGYREDSVKSFTDARTSIEKTKSDEEKYELLIKLGYAYNESKKYRRALNCYLKAEKFQNNDRSLLSAIAALYEIHFSQLGKALEYYSKAFLLAKAYYENEPIDFGGSSFKWDEKEIFTLFLKTNKYEDAIIFYEKAIKEYPNEIILFERISEFHSKLENKYIIEILPFEEKIETLLANGELEQLSKQLEEIEKEIKKQSSQDKVQLNKRKVEISGKIKKFDEEIKNNFSLIIEIYKNTEETLKKANAFYKKEIKNDSIDDLLFQQILKFSLRLENQYKTEIIFYEKKKEKIATELKKFCIQYINDLHVKLKANQDETLHFFERTYEEYSKSDFVLKGFTFFYLLTHNIPDAVAYYKQSAHIDIEWINSFFKETKNYLKAVDFYTSLIEAIPKRFDLHFELAYWCIYSEQHSRVVEAFLKYYSNNTDKESKYLFISEKEEIQRMYRAYCKLGLFPYGINAFQKIENKLKNERDKIYLKTFIGKLQSKAGWNSDSIETIRSVLHDSDNLNILDSENDHPIWTLRKSYMVEKRYDEAIEEHKAFLKKATEEKNLSYWIDDTLHSLGDVYFEKGDFNSAIKIYLKSMKYYLKDDQFKHLISYSKIKKISKEEVTKFLFGMVMLAKEKRKMNYAYSFLKKAIYIEKNNTDLPWILNGIKYRERYSRDLDFNKYEETLDQYKWVLKDADNATRIYTLALLKKEFHKTEEAVQDIKEYLENYKDNASESIAIKESMQYLLVNIFSERGNWNKEEKQISKVLQKYSGKDNYEDRFLNEQRHQENINTLEYQIFLETYFGDALSESSVERIAYQETVGQTKEAIIYIVYEIELLEGKIKTCRESERLSISLFLAFLNQRLFLLTKHDNFNEQALFTFIDETYDTFTYSRFDTKHDEPLYKRIITKINEAEQKWKKYFLELTAKNPEEFFNFQKEQLLIHEEMSKRTQEAENKLRFKFPKFDSLDAESRKLLITGEYIYKNLDASPKDSDYSSVVAQYSRAIENELGKKLGLKGMLGNKQNQLIDGILKINKPDSNLLKYIDKNELLEWDIFSEKYLGYSLNSNKNLNRDDYLWKDKNTFFEKIRNPRNAVSHSGEDSFFERARADKVIKDMTDFLLQWTEVNFEDQRIQLHQSKS